jgi:hypothetical protein
MACGQRTSAYAPTGNLWLGAVDFRTFTHRPFIRLFSEQEGVYQQRERYFPGNELRDTSGHFRAIGEGNSTLLCPYQHGKWSGYLLLSDR